MKKYFGKFASSGDVQTALDSGALSKPYVAVVGASMDYDSKEIDYASMPLTFEILSGGTIGWKCDANGTTYSKTIEYSKNGGSWVSITSTKNDYPSIDVVVGDIIQFRGDNIGYGVENWSDRKSHFVATAKFNVFGNIMSMITSTGYKTATTLTAAVAFEGLFSGIGVIGASNLVLPATTLSKECYSNMFGGCTSLTTAPVLPATSLSNGAYLSMFYNCQNLNYIKCLATDLSANSCTRFWVYDVSATGTFVKKAGVEWPSGNDGIPNGWTVIEE